MGENSAERVDRTAAPDLLQQPVGTGRGVGKGAGGLIVGRAREGGEGAGFQPHAFTGVITDASRAADAVKTVVFERTEFGLECGDAIAETGETVAVLAPAGDRIGPWALRARHRSVGRHRPVAAGLCPHVELRRARAFPG